jgi:hypothetical protein
VCATLGADNFSLIREKKNDWNQLMSIEDNKHAICWGIF